MQTNNSKPSFWENGMKAISLDNLHRNLHLTREAQRADIIRQTGSVPSEPDDMHIGDINNYSATAQNTGSNFMKYAGLAALGIFALPTIIWYAGTLMEEFRGNKEVPPPSVIHDDQDTKYKLKITKGEWRE